MTDEEKIVAQLIAKDFSGLEALIECFADSILATIRAILVRPEEQRYHEEIENDVFFTIWRKADCFDPQKSSLKTWVLLIARSKAIDQKRKAIKEESTELPDTKGQSEDSPLAKEHFLALIDSLSIEDQRLFLNYYFYQQTPERIADQLGITTAALYNRLSRGRKKLQQQLKRS